MTSKMIVKHDTISIDQMEARMSVAAKKRYQNTTVRLPRHVYEHAKTVAVQSQASSFNEFVVQAIEEKMRRLSEAEVDEAFAQMANDADYQRSSIAMAREFEKSDWEAFSPASPSGVAHDQLKNDQPKNDQPKNDQPKTRSHANSAKTRSR
jgi:L-lactate utilization protein LutC